MKTVWLTFSYLFFFGLGFASAQTYRAEYKYEYIPDSVNLESRKIIQTVLYSNEVNSWFTSEGNFKRDSLSTLVKNGKVSPYNAINEMRKFGKIDGYKFTVSKNYNAKETVLYSNIATQRYKYIDNASFDWEIGTEVKMILDYNCQIATLNFGGRNYVAWFTNEIPISDGPFLFEGLPGLIVSIQDNKNHHKFELISFRTDETYSNNELYQNELYVKTTKAEFLRTKKRYFENPDAFMESTGVTVISENAPKINPWRGVIKNSIILKEY